MTTLFRKTARGQAEIETRVNKLPPRLRSALIIVDGRRSAEELRALLPESEALLAALAEQGYIEAAEPAPTPRAPAEAVAAPRPDSGTRRREVARALIDLVGPAGEALAIRIEAAPSREHLRQLAGLAAQTVANTRGRGQAAAFAARFADL
jgi:hypothetical protein